MTTDASSGQCASCGTPIYAGVAAEGLCPACLLKMVVAGEPSDPQPFSTLVGRQLGNYQVVSLLGVGGMGVVCRAYDTKLQRTVALKLLGDAASDDDARGRVLREARQASRLNHPHICTIYEVAEVDGTSFIVLEYVDGRTVAKLIPPDGLSIDLVLTYGRQIADAVAHAHEHGIIHRDLKSANVMVTSQQRVKVLDFGLARSIPTSEMETVARSFASLDEAGRVAGTLAYMAPEALRGEPADVRADIWALGVVLHEMAAGALPFQGRTGFELSSAILQEPPRALPARVPAGLRAVIQRCLAKEPGQRYQQASEVRAALEALHSDASGSVALQANVVPARSGPLVVAAAVAILLLALAGTIYLVRERTRATSRDALTGQVTLASEPIRLAVLPFRTLTTLDSSIENISLALVENIIVKLATSTQGRLYVVPSALVVGFAEPGRRDLPAIARQFRLDRILDLSIQEIGDKVAIHLQLLDAKDMSVRWTAQFERERAHVGEIVETLPELVRAGLNVQLDPAAGRRLASVGTDSAESEHEFFLARQELLRQGVAGYERAERHFERAIALNPRFSRAYSSLAWLLANEVDAGLRLDPQTLRVAEQNAQEAARLDDANSEAYSTLGLIYQKTRGRAYDAYIATRRSLLIDPNNEGNLTQLVTLYVAWEMWDEGLNTLARIRGLNPSNASAWAGQARILFWQGRYDEAERFKDSCRAAPRHNPWLD
jgi:serine/threonine protein kinase/tetratricopeptide (TPR) repeat protein